ncbi:hypothetical protein [Roseivivax sp. CAU 1761]
MKFTTPIKEAGHAELGLDVGPHAYEELKDAVLPESRNMTPREFYIDKSERMRMGRGYDIVARLLVDSVKSLDSEVVVNTDLGMDYEVEHLIRHFGAENTVLVRLHRTGHSFANDCRQFVYRDDVPSVDIHNTSFEAFRERLSPIIAEVMERRQGLVFQPG